MEIALRCSQAGGNCQGSATYPAPLQARGKIVGNEMDSQSSTFMKGFDQQAGDPVCFVETTFLASLSDGTHPLQPLSNIKSAFCPVFSRFPPVAPMPPLFHGRPLDIISFALKLRVYLLDL
jgi:hypothetical protein